MSLQFISPQGGFRSNRSYPSLNHISLTPLTPRFPIDDDDEPEEFYSAQDDSSEEPYSAHIPQSRTSYISSRSVPGTPGLLSTSRSTSRTRHARSKSSNRSHTDPNLLSEDINTHFTPKKKSSRNHLGDPSARPDSEWMLRTGIALASSTREEKGQSWLEKRQSSTSLVSQGDDYGFDSPHHHRRSWSGGKLRSGASTPAALSRRNSRSRGGSRRNSRPGLTMTSLDMSYSQPHSRPSRSGMASPADELKEFMPAMVDERIREEFESIQGNREEDMFSLDDESDSVDEVDEEEMQRLTSERGFGLGGWFDRLLDWTLFGADEYPSSSRAHVSFDERSPDVSRSRSRSRDLSHVEDEEDEEDDDVSVDLNEDNNSTIPRDYDTPTKMDKPGERGGWEDAQWLLSVMKNALL